MNISQNKLDELNIELSLSIAAADYADKKKKRLTDQRRRAEIKGFRKGMVPMSLIEKMYGPQALYEAVNDVISESLNSFINENGLHVLGEPLPSEDEPQNEWKDGSDFNFKFDIALFPELSFEIGKDDEIPYYNINVTEQAKKEMKANMLKQYGNLEDGEAAGADDFIIADFRQGETSVEGAYVALRNVSEAVKSQFIGLKSGDVLDVDVTVAFENETDRAALLKVSKEELSAMEPVWNMTVINVKTFVPAPMTQETFDKIFGEGAVTSEEEFDAKVAENLAAEYTNESDYRFNQDAKKYFVEKSAIELPEKFLKRWLTLSNEGKFTAEDIEREFPSFIQDYKWQLVRAYIMEKYEIKVEEKDILDAAKGYASYQYAMYGINNVPEEQLEAFARSLMQQEKESHRIEEMVYDRKALTAVKENVTAKSKKISVEKFRELK